MTSSGDALQLLDKWRGQEHAIAVEFHGCGLRLELREVGILRVDDEELVLGRDKLSFSWNFGKASFTILSASSISIRSEKYGECFLKG